MPKAMKIGVVVDQLLAGGVQLAAIEQVKAFNKLGHQARLLILMRKKYPTDFSYLARGVPHQYLSDSYPLPFRQSVKFPIFSFFSTLHLLGPILAPKVIKEGDYDILVSHGSTTCLTTQALWRLRKIPYLAIIHDPMVYIMEKCYSQTLLKYFFPILKPLAKLVEYSFVKDAKKTIIISKVHSSYIKNNYKIKPKILIFGCETLEKLSSKRGSHLLSFGRWQKEKNPEFLLKLVKKIPRAKLIIAGSWLVTREMENFQEKIKKEKLSQRVKLVPHYNEKELKNLCRQSRLWLYPHYEAFGLAGLEAASHGLPLVVPKKSGVAEIFQHGRHGFFTQKIDLEEYRKYLKKLLANERLAYRMGKEAWEVVRKNYSWEASGQKLLAIIQSTLEVDQSPNFTVLEIGHFRGSLAGGDKLMEPMAIRLADQYQFTVIVPQIGAQHWQKASLKKEIKILPKNRFDYSGSAIPVFLTYCLRMWQACQVLIKQPRLDILYSSTNILPDVLPAYFAKKKRPQTTWIARIHHLIPPPHQREGRLIVNFVSYLMQLLTLRMIKNKADIIIALNKRLKKRLLKQGFLKKKLAVLGAGVEFEKITHFQPAVKRTVYEAAFLGRLHPAKGIFDAIPIWQEVVKKLPQAKMAIIGDGPVDIKIELEKEIKKAKLTKNIHLLGFLSYEDVFTIMKQAKVFLFLDHEAGWGLAVAEAMACGLPVIGYNIGVLEDVFQKGFTTVPNFNKLLFAQKIIDLLTNKPLCLQLAKLALSQAKQLSWDHTTQKFARILIQLG